MSHPAYQKTRYPGVYRRGGTFSYKISNAPRADGSKGDVWKGGFRTAREAREARTEVLSQVRHRTYTPANRITVSTFFEEKWLPAIQVRQSTKSSYEAIVRKHILPSLGAIRLAELDPSHLNSLYSRLLSNGRKDGQPLSPKSVRNIHIVIRKALEDARRWKLVSRNVAVDADPPRQLPPGSLMVRTWTSEELKSFLKHASDDRLAAAWHLAAMSGMRRGEILGLRWQDVDLEQGRLSVRQTLVSIDYKVVFSTPKTPNSKRSIPIATSTVSALRHHRAKQAAERLSQGPLYQDSNLVFTRSDGSAIHPVLFSQTFNSLSKTSGVPTIRLHDLRHTFATLALEAGINVKVVSELLGHSTVAFTLQVYSHAIPAMQEEAAEAFATFVNP